MIKAHDIAYCEYSVPDLEKMEAFLSDFGMIKVERTDDRLYMRGAGPHPYIHVSHKGDPGFVACAMSARSAEDLETISQHKDAISGVEEIDGPGGGKRVSLRAPGGFRIDVVHGIAKADELPVRDPLRVNFAKVKSRQGELQRPELEPARVVRIGHCVFKVPNEIEFRQWLMDTVGMLPSDHLQAPDNEDFTVGSFLRMDRGDQWTDHHSILCLESPDEVKIHHTSYETQDPDAVFIGHYWLRERGWQHEWGVGRHLLGSQVFDYWRDPWGHMFEHYADGDLLTADAKPGKYAATQENLAQWGPELSETFFN